MNTQVFPDLYPSHNSSHIPLLPELKNSGQFSHFEITETQANDLTLVPKIAPVDLLRKE